MLTYNIQIPENQKDFFERLIQNLGYQADYQHTEQTSQLSSKIKDLLDERLSEDVSTFKNARKSLEVIRSQYDL